MVSEDEYQFLYHFSLGETRPNTYFTERRPIYWWIQVYLNGLCNETNRRENDSAVFHTHSETWSKILNIWGYLQDKKNIGLLALSRWTYSRLSIYPSIPPYINPSICSPALLTSGFQTHLRATNVTCSCVRTAVQRQVAGCRWNQYMIFISCCLWFTALPSHPLILPSLSLTVKQGRECAEGWLHVREPC